MTSLPRASRLLLVDASPYLFRAFFSLPKSIRDGEGRPVNAVRGFADFLRRLLEEHPPTHLAVAFDDSLTTSFRNRIYSGYKSGREAPPPELVGQLDDARELAEALGCPTFREREYEADDVIATLCESLAGEVGEVLVVSSDKDLCQLVGERVRLLDFAREKLYGPDEVREKFGVRPGQIVELLALAGDSVDDIPGVAGIGAKTAAALLAVFDDIETLYAGLDRVEELELRGAAAVRRRLEAGREEAFLSRRLAVAARDAPIEARLEELAYGGPRRARLRALGERLGMRGLVERLGHGG